jgi:hypothetical protein
MQTIKETVSLLLIGVSVLRGILSQSVEIVKILNFIGVVLLQIEELIPLHHDQSRGYVSLPELGGELLPVDNMVGHLHSFKIFPPCSGRSREKVCGEKHLLVLSNIGYLQIVLDGAEPIVRIERCSALREHKWVGVLKVPQMRPWRFFTTSSFIVIVSVSRGKL